MRAVTAVVGGGGGGRPAMAQGRGQDGGKTGQAMEAFRAEATRTGWHKKLALGATARFLRGLARHFARSIQSELDLRIEARYCERIAANLRAIEDVVVPRIHWEWTGQRLLVQRDVADVVLVDLEGLADHRHALVHVGLGGTLTHGRVVQAVIDVVRVA